MFSQGQEWVTADKIEVCSILPIFQLLSRLEVLESERLCLKKCIDTDPATHMESELWRPRRSPLHACKRPAEEVVGKESTVSALLRSAKDFLERPRRLPQQLPAHNWREQTYETQVISVLRTALRMSALSCTLCQNVADFLLFLLSEIPEFPQKQNPSPFFVLPVSHWWI